MSETYSVTAILSAEDQGFTSTFNRAQSACAGLQKASGSATLSVGKIAAGLGVFKLASAAMGQFSQSMQAAVSRYDTLNQFPRVMAQMGQSTRAVNSALKTLDTGIDGLPTTMDDIVASTQRLTTITGNVGEASKLAVALNDAFLASGASSDEAARGMTQYDQALAKGKFDMQDWQSLQQGMSYGLSTVAKKLGIASGNTSELYDKLKSGQISMQDFNQALVACDQGTNGFAKTARSASEGIRTSIKNIGTAITKGLANSMFALNQGLKNSGLPQFNTMLASAKKAVNDFFGSATPQMDKSGKLVEKFNGGLVKTLADTKELKAILVSVAGGIAALTDVAALDQFNARLHASGGFFDILRAKALGAFNGIVSRSSAAGAALNTVMSRIKGTAQTGVGTISSLLTAGGHTALAKALPVFAQIPRVLASSFKWGVVAAAVIAGLGALNSVFGTQLQQIINTVATKAPEIASRFAQSFSTAFPRMMASGAKLISEFATAITQALPKLLSSARSIVDTITRGLTSNMDSIVQSAIQIITALGQGIAESLPDLLADGAQIITALVGAIADHAGEIATGAVKIIIALGKGLIENAPKLLEAGAKLITELVLGLVQALPQLLQGAVQIVSELVNDLIQNAPQFLQAGVSFIAQVGEGLVNGVGKILGNIGTAVSQIVDKFNSGFQNWASTLGSNLSSWIGSALTTISTVLGNIGTAISTTFTNAVNGANTALQNFSNFIGSTFQGVMTTIQNIITNITGAFSSLGSAIQNIFGGISSTIGGFVNTVGGFFGSLFGNVNTAMTGVASSTAAGSSSAEGSLAGLASSASASAQATTAGVQGGLAPLPGVGASAAGGLRNAIQAGTAPIPGIGRQAGNGFVQGVSASRGPAHSAGSSVAQGAASGMQTGDASGAGISLAQGFIGGIQSMVSRAAAAAANLASAAASAIGRFLKVGSPSRLMYDIGEFTGIGFVNALKDSVSSVRETARQMAQAAVPDVSRVSAAMAQTGGTLSTSCSYGFRDQITVDVPLYINGREFARATLDDRRTEDERYRKLQQMQKGVW